jgi:hypothetical protein
MGGGVLSRLAGALRALLGGEGGAGAARAPSPASGARQGKGRVLVVMDVENIWISARKLGVSVCFERLHGHLVRRHGATDLHAVCTHDPDGTLPVVALRASPWVTHTRDVTWVQRNGVWQKRANADTVFAAVAGTMAARLQPRRMLLLTGDGDLACETAEVVAAGLPRPPEVLALGVAGSVAKRISDGTPHLRFAGHLDLRAVGRGASRLRVVA